MRNLNVKGLHTFAVGEMQVLVPNTSGTDGMPQIGQELGRGAEGVVYENLDQPGWVVKEFHQGAAPRSRPETSFKNWRTLGPFFLTTWSRPKPPLLPDRASSSKSR
jgi:hypothetical protein